MRRLRLALVPLLACSVALPSQAALYNYVVTGTVDLSGFSQDPAKIFGPGVMNGDGFTATFVIDDANPTTFYDYSGVEIGGPGGPSMLAPGSIASGASGCTASAPTCGPIAPTFISAAVTVGGVTFGVPSIYPDVAPRPDATTTIRSLGGQVTKYYSGLHTGFFQDDSLELDATLLRSESLADGSNPFLSYEIDFRLFSTLFTSTDFREPLSIDLPSSSDPAGPPASRGFITVQDDIFAGGTETSNADAFVILDATHLTVSPVMEPTTWLLALIGFGAVGAAARRRGRAAAA
ncbi:PEP-CTERM sorting domain-containing protein [Sphingomonas nostoxanthinifaciens]|uniref:PEP-CTERM sorting domain-containing protein n=1 Tax=Sphingomonas nostoxanthinifaciens TaxID=2872652 RepID=UPI001CC1CA95|nr:PEP-CTERM sorting domain-containing protein [Sphingomonas nostoxanthinifaciens]